LNIKIITKIQNKIRSITNSIIITRQGSRC